MIVIMTVKISFEAALTALKTMTEFIEQQPDNSFVVRADRG